MRPLILITRPREGAEAFAEDLRAALGLAADICVAPLLEIEHCADLPDLNPYGALIFTSVHAVASFADATPRRDFLCYTVGEATAIAASENGFAPIIGPGTGKDLAAQILKNAPDPPCLYLHGDHVAFDIAEHLNSAGTETHDAIIYRQVPRPLPEDARNRISQADPVIAPVFSARSAQLLLDALPRDANLQIAAISNTAAAVVPAGRAVRIRVAASPDKSAMLSCVATLWSNANQLESGRTAQ